MIFDFEICATSPMDGLGPQRQNLIRIPILIRFANSCEGAAGYSEVCFVNAAEVLKVAYDTHLVSLTARADKHGLSRRQVSRHVKAVAYGYLMLQRQLLMLFVNAVHHLSRIAEFVLLDIFSYDETEQRLMLPCDGMLASQCLQAPHTFISLRDISVQGEGFDCGLPYISPPVACLSTTAGSLQCVFECLDGLGSHSEFLSFFDKIARSACDKLCARSIDGAGSNHKVFAWEVHKHKDDPSMHHVKHHCFFHTTNITMSCVTKCIFPKLTEQLFCATKFLCMGGHYLRLIYGPPPK